MILLSRFVTSIFLNNVYNFQNPQKVYLRKEELQDKLENGKLQQQKEIKLTIISSIVLVVLSTMFLLTSSLNIAMLILLVAIIVWAYLLIHAPGNKTKKIQFIRSIKN